MSDLDLDLAETRAVPIGDSPCPKCGSEVLLGFGLTGGDFGAYEMCDNGDCDYFTKPPTDVDHE